jgi:transcriptional regulator
MLFGVVNVHSLTRNSLGGLSHNNLRSGLTKVARRAIREGREYRTKQEQKMYIPQAFKVPDERAAFEFIEQYDFGTIVTTSLEGGMLATHLPLLVKRGVSRPVLQGHVARANTHWRTFDGSTEAIAIFQGPHGYISPRWYATAPAVPTWNYAVVHLHGRPLATENRELTSSILAALVHKYESHRPHPYRTQELPPDFYEQMLSRIVAFEMTIDRVEAKFKLGQNRSEQDRVGAIEGLIGEGSPAADALARFMSAHLNNSKH